MIVLMLMGWGMGGAHSSAHALHGFLRSADHEASLPAWSVQSLAACCRDQPNNSVQHHPNAANFYLDGSNPLMRYF